MEDYEDPVLPDYQTEHIVAGLPLTLHGLPLLPSTPGPITFVHLIHGRLSNPSSLYLFAAKLISKDSLRGKIIAVTHPARNHDTRQHSAVANAGFSINPHHARDMFGLYSGTAADVSSVLDLIVCCLPWAPIQVTHVVIGISLGGHAAWLLGANEPRVSGIVSVIGCANYVGLIEARAAKAGVDPWDKAPGFREAVERVDPTCLLKREGKEGIGKRFAGKQVLALYGEDDQLVPWGFSREFYEALASSIDSYETGPDKVTSMMDACGHEFGDYMLKKCVEWVGEHVSRFCSDLMQGKVI